MIINSDINILGGLPDFNLLLHFLYKNGKTLLINEPHHTYTVIKTDKSVRRFEKAIIISTLLGFKDRNVELLIRSILTGESISGDSLLLLFWNASYNNNLLNYLNDHIYFISFYSGRITIKQDEVVAYLKDLKERE